MNPKLNSRRKNYFCSNFVIVEICWLFSQYKQAYYDYMITITTMLGADQNEAMTDMTAVLEYETILADVSMTYIVC